MKSLKNIIGIIFGNTLYALAVVLFIIPSGLITGGSTGMSIAFEHVTGMSMSLFLSIFNITMFMIGYVVLGKKFALTTMLSTFYFPFILGILEEKIGNPVLTSDPLLAALMAGVMIGIAIGIVIKCNASTGGMDIPPLVLKKKLGIPVSLSMYTFDFLILLSQALYTPIEMVLYGLVLVMTYTIVLDKVLLFGKAQTEVKIVSKNYQEIQQKIMYELDRGTTLLMARTGYQNNDNPVILTIVSNRELPKLNQLVLEIDPNAFMVVGKVNEVQGRGFSFQKEYIQK